MERRVKDDRLSAASICELAREFDLFHERVPVDFLVRTFEVMRRASWHTFQVLTKRAERLARGATGSGSSGRTIRAFMNSPG